MRPSSVALGLCVTAALATATTTASAAETSAGPPASDAATRAAVPAEGVGLLVGGAIAAGLGAGMAIAGFGDSCKTCDASFNDRMGYAGIASLAAGAGLIVGGSVVRRRFVHWRDAHRLRVPKRGNGLFVGGGTVLGFGVVAFAMTPNAPKAAILGALWTLGGAGMIAGGAVLRSRFGRWKRSETTASLRVSPTFGRHTAGLTVVGRF
ncbi:MAG: hypothetical protein JNK45_13645 [Myxococcales bacterium]|nr:hypothetical protein [Myxococcales bacterium]